MKYDPFSLTELIRNDEFIAWVLHPDPISDLRWKQFLEANPGKRQTVESAREYVILLAKDTGRHMPSSTQSDKMWRAVESGMQDKEEAEAETDLFKPASGWRWIRVAASAAIILSVGSASYWFYYKDAAGSQIALPQGVPVKSSEGMIQKLNDTDKPMTILLHDGSSVVLQPGGRLSYVENKARNRREVTLTGKAFFEIVKDKSKPFLVYSYGVATKVLGTSFLVDASEDSEDIKVQVKTGTVSVFSLKNLEESDAQKMIDAPALQGVTLEHDQRITFSKQDGKISKPADAGKAEAAVKDISKQDFFFDETPVSEVFRAIEEAYNVQIVYDHQLMDNCPMSGTLVGQPFKEKLEVICNALDARFEIEGNRVTVVGRGCR